jgi:hypothetical protein
VSGARSEHAGEVVDPLYRRTANAIVFREPFAAINQRGEGTMQKRVQAGWFGLFQRTERAERSAQAGRAASASSSGARYPTHAYIVLPNGQLMRVRNASLAAAKDALAAQRAIERRLREELIAEPLRS